MLASMLLSIAGCNDYGVTRKVEEEAFVQDGGNLTIDLLFVLDNSQTMTEEQGLIAYAMPALVEAFASYESDWQLGVTTTDMETETAGQLIGGIFTDSSLVDDIAAAMDVGTEGHRDEMGLDAMKLATTEPLLSGQNAGFLRSSADFAAVFVSDEDDHSLSEVDTYASHLESLHGVDRGRAVAIVGQEPGGCDSPTAAADPGTRYLELARLTNGLEGSICLDDFSVMMEDLALTAMGLENRFQLRQVPELSTMEVWVDEEEMSRAETDGWSYDGGDNVVELHGAAVPPPGSTLLIRYYPWLGSGESEQETTTGG